MQGDLEKVNNAKRKNLVKDNLVSLISKIGEKLQFEGQIFLIITLVKIFFMFILLLKKILVK